MTFAVDASSVDDDKGAWLFKVSALRAACLDLGNRAQVEFVGQLVEARFQTNTVAALDNVRSLSHFQD
ncbi:hypothetical protein QA649_04790 [Bradyrhizobium sp. CB1717]|uniref:hypothetical protein n=1 Tax=Bradyrhizobium sp. CB1717 TaxID=3039154 RepID=UPI0024B1B414|nr:hypothetical protein [Bradyrhizobium sp. CB1717]WFU25544.1 hypothetical protein QA649_04790 [Bradyrhizobium sp. CB1717]